MPLTEPCLRFCRTRLFGNASLTHCLSSLGYESQFRVYPLSISMYGGYILGTHGVSATPFPPSRFRDFNGSMRWSDCHDAVSDPLPFMACGQDTRTSRTSWLSQVPTYSLWYHATDFDLAELFPPRQCGGKNAAFHGVLACRPLEVNIFRGSIPSLALKPDTSRLPASCSSLPCCMRDLVLGWWLAFAQAGLTPARTDKLAWRTELRFFCKQFIEYIYR